MAEQTKDNQGRSSTTSSSSRSGGSATGTKKQTSPIEQSSISTQSPVSTGSEFGDQFGQDKGLVKQVKSTAGEAFESATTKAKEKIEEQKSNLSGGLTNVASSIRQLGDNLGTQGSNDQIARLTSEFSRTAADKIERAANYFDQQDLNAMYRDLENVARRNPALVLGTAMALGFLAARFFKSSRPRQLRAAAGQPFNVPRQTPQMGGQASQGL
jgi:hypothetical protein